MLHSALSATMCRFGPIDGRCALIARKRFCEMGRWFGFNCLPCEASIYHRVPCVPALRGNACGNALVRSLSTGTWVDDAEWGRRHKIRRRVIDRYDKVPSARGRTQVQNTMYRQPPRRPGHPPASGRAEVEGMGRFGCLDSSGRALQVGRSNPRLSCH